MIPSILKDFNIFYESGSWIGLANEIELPKLAKKMEEIFMGNGTIKVAMGNEAMEATVTLDGMPEEVLRAFGECDVSGIALRFAGAYERQDATCETSSLEIVMRGRFEELDFGSAKKGDKSQSKHKMAVAYLKVMIDGDEVIELDHVNYIERVGGVDRLAKTRAAIGL
jgi:P2 family phage contractile tail tube protein